MQYYRSRASATPHVMMIRDEMEQHNVHNKRNNNDNKTQQASESSDGEGRYKDAGSCNETCQKARVVPTLHISNNVQNGATNKKKVKPRYTIKMLVPLLWRIIYFWTFNMMINFWTQIIHTYIHLSHIHKS